MTAAEIDALEQAADVAGLAAACRKLLTEYHLLVEAALPLQGPGALPARCTVCQVLVVRDPNGYVSAHNECEGSGTIGADCHCQDSE